MYFQLYRITAEFAAVIPGALITLPDMADRIQKKFCRSRTFSEII